MLLIAYRRPNIRNILCRRSCVQMMTEGTRLADRLGFVRLRVVTLHASEWRTTIIR
jgi:hypothetical protein